MNVSQVQIQNLTNPPSGELSDLFIQFCEFCYKKCSNQEENFQLCQDLSGTHLHYCEFCIRNSFNTKRRNNILILNFKTIIAWFYHQNYLCGHHKKMWFHEVCDYIELHQKTGMNNPLFMYDSCNLNWFVDFSRIGNENNQINLQFVTNNIDKIIASFKLNKNIPLVDIEKFSKKYHQAIEVFAQSRERPNGKRILSPTFAECLPADIKIPHDKIKNFSLSVLECKKYS